MSTVEIYALAHGISNKQAKRLLKRKKKSATDAINRAVRGQPVAGTGRPRGQVKR